MVFTIGGKIERVNGKELSYKEFAERYLRRNEPVLLTGLMEGWRACEDWVDRDGRPNLAFFSTHFGASRVQVADCSRKEFTDQKRTEMSVLEFIDYWHGLSAGNSGNNPGRNMDSQRLLYLKDWHFVKEYHGYMAYTTPSFFIDDWLNLYLDSYSLHHNSYMQHDKNEINCSDYRFVYMGPKGTWTPLHADVFRSYSWSANVCGKKQWYLLPPSQCHHLLDRSQRNTMYDIFDEVSSEQFPGFVQTVWWECIQEKGEIIFVPSGWFHQVHNLEDTISINHNWFNGYNLSFLWNLLVNDYGEAKDYIEDIRDICDNFEWLCQRNLAANTGMNFYDFFMFIIRFTLACSILLYHLKKVENSSIYSSSQERQLIFNLIAMHKVAKNMEPVEAFTKENQHSFPGANWSALLDIIRIMGEHRFHEFTMAIKKTYEFTDEPREQDINFNCSSLHTGSCLYPCISQPCLGMLDFLQGSEPKICGPSDLVRLIEHVFKGLNGIDISLFRELSCDISSFTCQRC